MTPGCANCCVQLAWSFCPHNHPWARAGRQSEHWNRNNWLSAITQSGEKPDKCNQCDSTSCDAGTLSKHMRGGHNHSWRIGRDTITVGERRRAGGCHQSISGTMVDHGNQRKAAAPNTNMQLNKGSTDFVLHAPQSRWYQESEYKYESDWRSENILKHLTSSWEQLRTHQR